MPPIATTNTKASEIDKGHGMSADDIFFWANWVLVGALVLGVLATYAIVVSGSIRDRELKKELKEKDDRISSANERAKQLEKDAANARLEQERLKSVVAWRSLTKEQHDPLITSLKGHKFSVWTSWVGKDPEATIFRNQIDATLKEAGLETKHFSGWEMAIGLQIRNLPGKDYDILMRAFQKANIPFESVSPNNFSPDELLIIVGTKPPPF